MLYAPRRSLSGAPLSVSPRQSPLLHIRPEQSFYACAPAKRYTPDHEVITFDDERGAGTVSITDYAQKSLGDVVFVELPQAGTTIEQGGESLVGFPPKTVVPRPNLPRI
jgi:Glycine cleavage H-protein